MTSLFTILLSLLIPWLETSTSFGFMALEGTCVGWDKHGSNGSVTMDFSDVTGLLNLVEG